MISSEIKKYIDSSVLCWLATSNKESEPNVSPKEVFTTYKNTIIIANIASPQTEKNIKENTQVCLSFIDILVQKGFQIKGKAQIITSTNPNFDGMKESLEKISHGRFPFTSITQITIEKAKPILAPSYLLYPSTSEADQIKNAKKRYGIL